MRNEALAGREINEHEINEQQRNGGQPTPPLAQESRPRPAPAQTPPAEMNVGSLERWLSILAGGALLFRLLRKYGFLMGGAWLVAYLLLRGVTGRCALYRIAQVDSRRLNQWLFPGSRPCTDEDVAEKQLERRLEAESNMDEIDRASNASFPASDPPATW